MKGLWEGEGGKRFKKSMKITGKKQTEEEIVHNVRLKVEAANFKYVEEQCIENHDNSWQAPVMQIA